MKLLFTLFLFTVSFSVCAENKQINMECGDHGSILKSKHSNIITTAKLPKKPESPSLYMFVGESYRYHHYVVYIKPEYLIAELKRKIEIDSYRDDEAFLEALEKDLPLKNDTDIYKYGLINPLLMEAPSKHVVSLLGKGQASLIDLWNFVPNTAVTEVKVSNMESIGGKFRDICELNGNSIIHVTDAIYN